jgi:hypothetical protein
MICYHVINQHKTFEDQVNSGQWVMKRDFMQKMLIVKNHSQNCGFKFKVTITSKEINCNTICTKDEKPLVNWLALPSINNSSNCIF